MKSRGLGTGNGTGNHRLHFFFFSEDFSDISGDHLPLICQCLDLAGCLRSLVAQLPTNRASTTYGQIALSFEKPFSNISLSYNPPPTEMQGTSKQLYSHVH